MKFNFDTDKIERLNSDYTLFHPSIDQMKILYYMAEQLSQTLGCDEFTCRNLLIQCYINVQQNQELFHSMVDKELPQFRLKYAEAVYLEIERTLIRLLENEDQHQLLKDELKNLFDKYFSKFATR